MPDIYLQNENMGEEYDRNRQGTVEYAKHLLG